MAEADQLVDRIIALRGEEDLAPPRADWLAIMERPEDEPFNVLDLLQCRAAVETQNGVIYRVAAYGQFSDAVDALPPESVRGRRYTRRPRL